MSLARAALNLSASRAHALGGGRLRTDRRITNARRRVSTTASAEMKTVRARGSRGVGPIPNPHARRGRVVTCFGVSRAPLCAAADDANATPPYFRRFLSTSVSSAPA